MSLALVAWSIFCWVCSGVTAVTAVTVVYSHGYLEKGKGRGREGTP